MIVFFRHLCRVFSLLVVTVLLHALPAPVQAQPTYKLDVKTHLKPLATLKLEGNSLTRTELEDDPGFRLQYHIKQPDGKSILTVEARSSARLDLPIQTTGTFIATLELFYPGYKGGTGQKGEFKPISNVLTYKVEAGKITLIEPPMPKDKK